MRGLLHKIENRWEVTYGNNQSIPIHPYFEKYYFLNEDAEGGEVDYDIEDFWETGMEKVINVAKLNKINLADKK